MTKYKLTHKVFVGGFFMRYPYYEKTMIIELKIDNQQERDKAERYLKGAGDDDEFEWEFISKAYNLGNCGVK